ncbi:AraC family transcriptional regulator [Pedobacter sp. SYSU D00535]|uniref:helix-turn-helix domain-containing protein n=1 Tax=Pedobacter sp. SYSU D00535 TaxID=2810308 RepID=UPI001F616379|nr:AraC family transcriptional regulator [Pedobacter sp. SYSU D00535]
MPLSTAEMLKACGLLSEIKTELVETKPDSVHIIRALLYYLLQSLNRQYANRNNLSLIKSENNYAYQFKRLLENHIRKKQRVNDYAEMLGISRIFLNKAVKTQFNQTATDIIKQRLLIEIQNLLIYSNKTLSEIAFELGFSEPNHLMRFFKSQTNQTTSQFLADHRSAFK